MWEEAVQKLILSMIKKGIDGDIEKANDNNFNIIQIRNNFEYYMLLRTENTRHIYSLKDYL